MGWYSLSDGQIAFNQSMKGLSIAVRLLTLAVIFSPLLAVGYWICTHFIALSAPGHTWLMAVLAVAFLLYIILVLLKAMIIGLREKGSFFWIPLFLCCTAFTCALPGFLIYPVAQWITGHITALTWILEALALYIIYGQYNFLNQRLPFFRYH